MTTFAELGIPFPLFEAATTEAPDYVGLSSCRLCGAAGRHCHRLDIGCRVVVLCPSCGLENGLDTHDREDAPCRSCGVTVTFLASLKKVKDILICYECLRAGKGAMTKDTEFGMVSWEQAIQGVTHGVPGLQTNEFERVLIDPEEDWYGVRVPQEHLFEILRTPAYMTWQGECWLFCCKRPMTYIGDWHNSLQSAGQLGDPRVYFDTLFDQEEQREWVWERIRRGSGGVCVYVFRCKSCGRLRSTWDMD